ARSFLLHPEQMTEPDRSYSRDVPQRLPSHVASQPLSQKQHLGQAELRPCRMRLRMKTACHRLDRCDSAGGEWLNLSKAKGCSFIGDSEDVAPGVLLDRGPAA